MILGKAEDAMKKNNSGKPLFDMITSILMLMCIQKITIRNEKQAKKNQTNKQNFKISY